MRHIAAGILSAFLICTPAAAFDAGHATFPLTINGFKVPFKTFSFSVMPGDKVDLRLPASATVRNSGGSVSGAGENRGWQAPETPGLHQLTVFARGTSITVNMFVLRPTAEIKNGKLGDYRIGEYQSKPMRDLAAYRYPRGLIEVSAEMANLRVSPHFTLGEFLCKQASGWPKYLLLREQLLTKLEYALQVFEENGIDTSGVVVMSGYRTPWYNKSIGNRTVYSRHLYGGAADIYIDSAPKDGVMDDVNRDGKLDRGDARHLYQLVDHWTANDPRAAELRGGLSHYRANAAHGPFLHVDTRGHRARW